MKISHSINRRHFIQQMGLLTGVATAPTILSAQSWANTNSDPANDRLNAAVVGLGKQGSGLLYGFLRTPGVQVVALCDVDREKLARAQSQVNHYYTQKNGSTFSGCRATVDYREIVGSDDINIVIFATPDHWHVQQSVEAARAGKDIYCEKPLTLTIAEARLLVNEIRRHERILQTGSMQRSMGHFRFACELVQNGYIGDVHHVRVSIATGFLPHPIDCDLPAEPKPDALEWDLWQGQAPVRPYHSMIAPPISFDGYPAWRNYRAYSGGGMTDWGAHHFDIAQWGLGADETGPIKIIPASQSESRLLTYHYRNGVVMTTDFEDNYIRFEGSKGTIQVNREYLHTNPESLMTVKINPNEIHLQQSDNHINDFIQSVRRRTRPITDAEIGARSVTVCHLGNLAHQLGRAIEWDPDKEEFINDDEANRLCSRARRSPWVI